jgi:hypothetical protein
MTHKTPNPALKKLGFANNDRVAIIHTDDIGMSHGSVAAAQDLWQAGIISSSAVMVPCPWFLDVAALCKANPKIDMGVHLTLTSEWHGYRWGPVSTRDAASGLIDPAGYFWHSTQDIWQHGHPNAVAAEFEAQVQRALAAGIKPTHCDTHMGTAFHPKFIDAYVRLALTYKIPVMLPRLDEAGLRQWGYKDDDIPWAFGVIAHVEELGLALVDHITGMPLDKPENRLEQLLHALDALPAGITHFVIHPSHDTPEARAIGSDLPSRVGDYETLMDDRVRQHIQQTGLQVIGYAALQQLLV